MGYLKPLRRKIGLVTLVVACAFVVGWVRSLTLEEDVWIVRNGVRYGLSSWEGRIEYLRLDYRKLEDNGALPSPQIGRRSESLRQPPPKQPIWIFRNAMRIENQMCPVHWVSFPYVAVILPLTVLSAWLLLSKPKRANPRRQSLTQDSPNG